VPAGRFRRPLVEGGRPRLAHPVPALRALQHAGRRPGRLREQPGDRRHAADGGSGLQADRAHRVEIRLAAAQERGLDRSKPVEHRARLPLLALAALLACAAPSPAKVFLSQEEALKLAFPGAKVERQSLFLTDAEVAEVAKLSGGPRPSALATAYAAMKDGKL